MRIAHDRVAEEFQISKKGKVRVRDFRRKRTIIVRAGQSYLAKPSSLRR